MTSMSGDGEGGRRGGEVEMEGVEQEVISVKGETQEISCSESLHRLFRFSSTCALCPLHWAESDCCCLAATAGPRLINVAWLLY